MTKKNGTIPVASNGKARKESLKRENITLQT